MNGKPLIRMDFPASEHPSKKNGKSILCLSARVDPLNDTVQSIDCSYKADGW